MKPILAIVISLLFLSFFPLSLKKERPLLSIKEVSIVSGKISGTTGRNAEIKVFKGIPFAAPPVGDLRWKAPQEVTPWAGVRKCDVFSASAYQNPPVPFAMWTKEFMAPLSPLSEDCLYLNVWSAATYSDEKRPVMVWIHGGAFTGGSGSVPLYDGETMAKKGVVFITINYRLGIFGFFSHPELSSESPNKVSGNYGILDQIAALQWVKKNVEAFGGDSNNVTIAGQSAGAFSVNALTVSSLAKGLFHKAIAHSGGMLSNSLMREQSLKDAEKSGVKFMEQLKATSIKDLRNKSSEELLKAGGGYGLVTDGYVLPSAYQTYLTGKQNDVPLLTGWNGDDGVSFGEPPTAKIFIENAKNQYKDKSEDFLKVFPASNDDEAKASSKLASQLTFGFLNYRWALLQTKTGKNKAYLYYFTHVPPGEPNYGAFHSAEFGYALGTLGLWDKPWKPYDHQLSDMMSSYWVNFAATGNPNGKNLPLWPEFNPNNPKIVLFGDQVLSQDLPHRQQLEVLDKLN